MKRISALCLLLSLSAHLCFAQLEMEKMVNEDVWKPFIESWEAGDAVAFNALHTDDILRVSSRGLKIGQDYMDSNTEAFAGRAQYPGKRTIRFRFSERSYLEDTGYEVGFYKVVVSREGSEDRTFYARFHVRLQRVNGVWKIAQDWDTNNISGRQFTEEDWQKAAAMEH